RSYPGRYYRHNRAWERSAAGALAAEDGVRRMVRDDEPYRTAMRHRSWPDQDEGRSGSEWCLPNHGSEDLHFSGRARFDREYRAQVPATGRWEPGRAQWGRLRVDRTQDGHPRQCHLRDEL